MENSNQLTKLDHTKILDLLNKLPDLSETDKRELQKQIASDDIRLRSEAFNKLAQSQIAQHDLQQILAEVSAINKKGMYIKAKQVVKTGSGQFEIEMKGGDSNLIIPVLTIFGVVIIVFLIAMFWN